MNPKFNRLLKSFYHYFVFFLLVAFVITCCIMLFVSTLMDSTGIQFTEEDLQKAAKLTFGNVLLFSLLLTLADALRKKLTVERYVKQITQASEKLMQGDFSVRIKPIRTLYMADQFNEIIDCFNKMAEELASIETLRNDFISNVSHELKTPLAVIQNYSTMLARRGLAEEEKAEYCKAISSASGNLSSLISNILKLNKLENQQIFPTLEKYDLGEQLCECLLEFESAWEKKELEIETDIAEEVYVKTDAELMTLVWNNLFSNAIKFTSKGGKISLRLFADEKYAFVEISDTGCGISKEVGEHMFEKFYQGDTSHATQGNGLGLTLVKRVIDIVGCDIFVHSEIGVGTTFTVKIERF